MAAAALVVDLAGDPDRAGVQVNVLRGERGEFGPAEAGEGGQQDQRSIAGRDGVGKGVDLGDGEHGTFGRDLVASALNAAWVAADQPDVYGGVQNGAKQPIRLGNSDRTDAVVEQLLMPAGTVAKWSRATVMVGKYGAMCERSR